MRNDLLTVAREALESASPVKEKEVSYWAKNCHNDRQWDYFQDLCSSQYYSYVAMDSRADALRLAIHDCELYRARVAFYEGMEEDDEGAWYNRLGALTGACDFIEFVLQSKVYLSKLEEEL